MHIFITTIGTRGDVEPYVALGQRLITSGHRVTLCSCEKFRDFITEQGLEYGYLNNSFMEVRPAATALRKERLAPRAISIFTKFTS